MPLVICSSFTICKRTDINECHHCIPHIELMDCGKESLHCPYIGERVICTEIKNTDLYICGSGIECGFDCRHKFF